METDEADTRTSCLGLSLWRAAFVSVVIVFWTGILPVVDWLEPSGYFATSVMSFFTALALTGILFIDGLIAWIRLLYGTRHPRKVLRVALTGTLVVALVVL